jgi:DNA-directed RNA polymerase subunit RPC12/RpoP
MPKCVECGKTFILDIFDKSTDGLCPACGKVAKAKSKHEDEERQVAEGKQADQENELAGAQIILSTGQVGRPYEVLDVVFAIDLADPSAFARRGSADAGAAFNKVKMLLRHQCAARGGNAVMHCQFFQRVAEGSNLPAGKQPVEIFAYGTAVKFI